MVVTVVSILVKPEHREAFVAATLANHAASVAEPGNLRFDVLEAAEEPERFILYEAYASAEAAAAHKQTAHYATWRDTVADMMAVPRVGLPCRALAPTDPAAW